MSPMRALLALALLTTSCAAPHGSARVSVTELAAPEGKGRRAGAAAVTVRLRLEYTPADLAAVDVARDATGLSVNL